jgi:3-oxoadipate enol-lactonase
MTYPVRGAARALFVATLLLAAGGHANAAAIDAPMKWIDADGYSLHYQLTGSGRDTLVLIHELQTAMQVWDEELPALARDHRILRYDLPGFGLSEKIHGDISMDDEEAILLALLDGLGIKQKVTLIGSAVGGAIAVKFAADHPDRVHAVIGFSAAAYMTSQLDVFNKMQGNLSGSLRERAERSGLKDTYPEKLRTPERWARYRGLMLASDPQSVVATSKMFASVGFADILPRVHVPTLIVATSLFARPVESFKEIADHIPAPYGHFAVLETGHHAPISSPELTVRTIKTFLANIGKD